MCVSGHLASLRDADGRSWESRSSPFRGRRRACPELQMASETPEEKAASKKYQAVQGPPHKSASHDAARDERGARRELAAHSRLSTFEAAKESARES
eukprot:scaffold1172_cov247-Pinguiococcus_pyrenoidosus.AAC.3